MVRRTYVTVGVAFALAVAGTTRADPRKPLPTWFVINHDIERCVAAASISRYPSPGAAHAAFAAAGQADVLNVYRSPTGEVTSIAEDIPGVGGIMWFTDMQTCDRVRELAKRHPERPGNYGLGRGVTK